MNGCVYLLTQMLHFEKGFEKGVLNAVFHFDGDLWCFAFSVCSFVNCV